MCPELAIYRQSIYVDKTILELYFKSQNAEEYGKGRNVRTVIVSRINVSGDSDILISVRVILFFGFSLLLSTRFHGIEFNSFHFHFEEQRIFSDFILFFLSFLLTLAILPLVKRPRRVY